MLRTAEIIAVGNELLTGGVTNTNARFLSQLLTEQGIQVLYHTAVGDDPARLQSAVSAARQRSELLVFTGGLGPTCDDLTKTAVCAALDMPLVFHPDIVPEMQRYFDTVFHQEMPACNLQQAYLPEGCTVFHNPVGTAPGCVFTAGGVTAVLLPGVPSECRYLAERCLLPWLAAQRGQVTRSHDLRIFGLTEPQVQELLDDLLRREDDGTFTLVLPNLSTLTTDDGQTLTYGVTLMNRVTVQATTNANLTGTDPAYATSEERELSFGG